MEYKDYLKDENLNDVAIEYKPYNLRINKLYGYIYRGDTHKNIVMSSEPRFYGSLESSVEYLLKDGDIMKRYTTMKKLTILDLSNIDNNFKNIMRFFEEKFISEKSNRYETEEIILEKKIMVILLQVCFGIILNHKLNLYGIEKSQLVNYFDQKGIDRTDAEVVFFIKEIFSMENSTVPSRLSVRTYDKLLMKLLRKYLKKYNIDGIMYIEPIVDDSNKLLCVRFNKFLKSNASMCTPTEVCIFEPSKNLGAIKMWELKKNELIEIKHSFKRHIKKKYNKMSIYNLYRYMNSL